MKSKIYIISIFMMCITTLMANGVKIDGIHYILDKSSMTASVTYSGLYIPPKGNNSYKGHVRIPEKVTYMGNTYSVTKIDISAFNQSEISSINIPNSVTSIGKEAFYRCTGLTNIIIPNSVTEIGYDAFCGCNSLTYITLSNKLTKISGYTFSGCRSLRSMTLPNNITEIKNCAFDGCVGLTKITLPTSLKSIGDYAFRNCSNLNSITIPNDVETIGKRIFEGCKNLQEIHFPANLQIYFALSTPTSATKLFPHNPETGEIVSSSLEKKCGENVFWELDNNSGILTISGDGSMWNWDKDTQCPPWYVPWKKIMTGNEAFIAGLQKKEDEKVKNVVIKTGVTTIGDFAFYVCKGISSITLPSTLTTIGKYAFPDGDARLTSIYVDGSNSFFCDIDGVLYNKSLTKLIKYPAGRKTSTYSIPNGVTIIGENAFSDCKNLNSIMLPASVSSVERNAFANCCNLKDFYYPDKADISKANIPYSTNRVPYASPQNTAKAVTPRNNPTCRIISHKNGAPYSTPTIKLRYEITNASSERYSVLFYVAGFPVTPIAQTHQKGAQTVNGTEVELKMPQYKETAVAVRLVDVNGYPLSEDNVTLEYVNERKPTLHVFAVGLNKYKAEDFKDLRYAENDARDFTKTIMDLADKKMYNRVDTTLILGSRANRNYILAQLMKLEKRVEPNDIVMLFFSGHGKVENNKSYFITSDAEYVIQGLATRDISDQIELMKKKGNVFVFMDACHSGAMNIGRAKGYTKPITLAESEVIGYYSCAEKEESIEDDKLENGVFTYALINSLKGKVANEGQITIRELDEAVRKWVSDKTKGKQSPTLDYRGSDYVLFYKKK